MARPNTITALAAALAACLLGACSAPQPRGDSNLRDRVELGSKLLDLADVAQTIFQNQVIAAYVRGDSRELITMRETLRNGAYSNVRSLALGADPYGALVDLYVWAHLAEVACENRNRVKPELRYDCESTYGEVQRRLETIIVHSELMDAEQRKQLDGIIAKFVESHPDMLQAGLFRIEDLAEFSGSRMEVIERAPKDMLSPVEDAVAQLEQARLIARQLVWLASRLPTQAGWEAQTVVDQALTSPEIRSLDGNLKALATNLDQAHNRLDRVGSDVRALSDSVEALGKEVSTLTAAREIVRDVVIGAVVLLAIAVVSGAIAVRHVAARIERAVRDGRPGADAAK